MCRDVVVCGIIAGLAGGYLAAESVALQVLVCAVFGASSRIAYDCYFGTDTNLKLLVNFCSFVFVWPTNIGLSPF